MKKQLRNMMLAGAATLLAGNAWAAGTTAVTEGENAQLTIDWEQSLPDDWIVSTGRYGTAVKGSNEMLVMNSTAKSIWAFDAEGKREVVTGLPTTPFGITCDEAGNVIFNKGGGASAGATDFYILPAGSRDIADLQNLNLTLPEGLDLGRVDQLGRVLGNVLSTEGAWLNTAMNTQKAIASYYISEGEVIDSYASLNLPNGAAVNTFFVSQPWGTSVEECQNASDPSMTAYVFQGNGNTFYGPNVDFDDWQGYSRVNQRSAVGFDWFLLGEETYFVYGAKLEGRAGTWCPGDFVIVRASDNAIVASYTAPIDTPTGAATGSIICYANEDGKSATIYRYSSISGAAKLTFTVGGDTPAPAPLYAVGAWSGWDPSSPDEFVYENGKYTLTVGNKDDQSTWVSEFKLSTTKSETAGDWAGFEAGVMCVADDQKIEENGKEYPLFIGGNANILFGWPSQWTITVDLEAKTISAVAATEKPVVTTGDPLYIVGDNGTSFDPANPGEFTYDAAANTYSYSLVNAKYGFKISTAKGSWDAFNAAGFHIDGQLAPNTVTPLLEGSPANGNNITFTTVADYTIVVDLANMTIEAKGSTTVTAPDKFFVIGEIAAGSWDPSKGVELTKNGNIFEGDVAMVGGHFSFTEKLSPVAGNAGWSQMGQRYGAANNNQETHLNTPLPFMKGENSFDIWDYSEYPQDVHFVVDFENMTVTISTATGVEDIAVDAAAPAEYYNLQGIRVAQPEAGKLYIVKQGDKVSKMLVK